ncbi:MAG: sugar transferase [Rhodospirillaceae bacterium]|nr:sugar transferase [Rhodospirillaceae bacterium]
MIGCPIVGTPDELDRIVVEYAVHGIAIDRVVIAQPAEELSATARRQLDALVHKGIHIDVLDEGLFLPKSIARRRVAFVDTPELAAERDRILRRPYWAVKRLFDVGLAAGLLVLLAPTALTICVVSALTIGMPVLFWQRRIGRHGRPITIYKFRTLYAPFDSAGRPIPEEQRLGTVGRLLRASHLDEIPQLISVLTGDMSMVGPRPLLPEDQPKAVGLRLMVAPGLSGWAQVNGGKLVTVDEKNALDEWYVRHASLWLDLRIMLRTLCMVGERRDEAAIAAALAEARQHPSPGATEQPFRGQGARPPRAAARPAPPLRHVPAAPRSGEAGTATPAATWCSRRQEEIVAPLAVAEAAPRIEGG